MIASLLAMALGVWWILQGTGIVPVGFMANNMDWTYRGIALVVVGLIAFVFSRRR
jgi:hypothetical protein